MAIAFDHLAVLLGLLKSHDLALTSYSTGPAGEIMFTAIPFQANLGDAAERLVEPKNR